MIDLKDAAAVAFTALVAWFIFRWWQKGYRTGVITTRWGREERTTQPVAYWFTMSYIAMLWLVMAAVSVGLFLMGVGLIDKG